MPLSVGNQLLYAFKKFGFIFLDSFIQKCFVMIEYKSVKFLAKIRCGTKCRDCLCHFHSHIGSICALHNKYTFFIFCPFIFVLSKQKPFSIFLKIGYCQFAAPTLEFRLIHPNAVIFNIPQSIDNI